MRYWPGGCSRHTVPRIVSLLAAVAAKANAETTHAALSGWWGRERAPDINYGVET